MSFCKLSNDTLVSAISVLVKKIFTKNRSDVHYFSTDFRFIPKQIATYLGFIIINKIRMIVILTDEKRTDLKEKLEAF